jgi:hypothetical protein
MSPPRTAFTGDEKSLWNVSRFGPCVRVTAAAASLVSDWLTWLTLETLLTLADGCTPPIPLIPVCRLDMKKDECGEYRQAIKKLL